MILLALPVCAWESCGKVVAQKILKIGLMGKTRQGHRGLAEGHSELLNKENLRRASPRSYFLMSTKRGAHKVSN